MARLDVLSRPRAVGFSSTSGSASGSIGERRARGRPHHRDAERDAGQTACKTRRARGARRATLKARAALRGRDAPARARDPARSSSACSRRKKSSPASSSSSSGGSTSRARRTESLTGRERPVAEKERRLAVALDEQRRKLESIASLTAEEAKRQLLAQMEDRGAPRGAADRRCGWRRRRARPRSEKAKEVLATTIQRLAPDYTVETAVSVVDLPVRRHEGPHHRPRGAQHPRARAAHRRRPHRGRHARGGADLRLRSLPPRDRAAARCSG